MNSRIIFSAILTVLVVVLIICIVFARRSHKAIGKSVAWLDAALIPPIIGNLIIIGAHLRILAEIGYYIYFIGMNVVMLSLINFAAAYCRTGRTVRHKVPAVLYYALAADAVQMLLNPFFGHAFGLEETEFEGLIYYKLVPYWGQIIHRVVDYSIFFMVIAVFVAANFVTSRIFREKYRIIIISMIAIGLWQTFYIFSRAPIDRSMIGYGVFGLLVFYFSIHYRPLRLLDRMLSNIASEMSEAMFLYDPTDRCIWMNEAGKQLTGLDNSELEEVIPKLTEMFGKLEYSEEDIFFNKELGTGSDRRYYDISKCITRDENGRRTGTVVRIRDNTEKQLRIKQELYNATHDKLTGLYTREYLYECIRKTMQNSPGKAYLAIFIDVKNFKIVNDVFGKEFGDYAIICIADMIREDMSENCVYGRLAGDTFGIFVPTEEFDREKVEAKLSQFTVKNGTAEHHILIHLGVYEITDPDTDVSVMFDRAHLALAPIKDQFNTHIAYYDNTIRENVLWNQTISAELGMAIAEMQIRPYLQPIADGMGRIVGAEALARWMHPVHGFLPPYKFIPIFEKNGIIVEVDKHIWRCACDILSKWDNEMFISVNISPIDFYYTDISATLKSLVQEYGIKPARLRIEITESVMMSDSDERMKVLDELRQCGFIVEMDDFGSGYSSLNLLKTMPVDVLKIDMMFLSKADENNRSQTIIRNIIRLSRELGIETLTEGVETEEQYAALNAMGCDLFQGYYFAKPLPVEEFEALYRGRS